VHRVKVLSLMGLEERHLRLIRDVSPQIIVVQPRDEEGGKRHLLDVEVVYSDRIWFDLAEAPRLKWVQLGGAGIDHLLGSDLLASDIVLTTSKGVQDVSVAEYAFALMLSLARGLHRAMRCQIAREWPADRYQLLQGEELRDKTIGIVGYGHIGQEVARRARCFGMKVLATMRSVSRHRVEPEVELFPPEQLVELLSKSDFVAITVPLTSETKGMIGEKELKAMRVQAYLVDVSRGGVINERALVRALQEKWIAGAGLDVFAQEPLSSDSPLYNLSNIIISPHVAWNTSSYLDKAVQLFCRNLRRYLSGDKLLSTVQKGKEY
jgi:D-2-hydroxyacid dehydrogenase (NADP+)